ncbi:MAG: class I SAM-dependent methyltransferase, partial [Burkholderiales bacterium]
YRTAMARRLYRRAEVAGRIALPAVPSMIDEYVTMCDSVFRGIGVSFSDEDLSKLRGILANELATAFAASPRSEIIITYECPAGFVVNYHVKAQWYSLEAEYEKWLALRKPPFFGTDPDARVLTLALEAQAPETFPILDVGAGTGRNTLPLARRGHSVDAVELTARFADMIRDEAKRESLNIRVLQQDIFDSTALLRQDYQLVILSEVVTDFRTTEQLRSVFKLATESLATGGHLVLNAFLTKDGYIPDGAAREFGQQCYSAIFTRLEFAAAAEGLSLDLESDESACDFEKANLPPDAWPPTNWYESWANGQDVFDLEREMSPVELRWLVYRKVD